MLFGLPKEFVKMSRGIAQCLCNFICCALENTCTGCGFEAPSDARYCPRCGRETPFEVYHVFDPAVRRQEARLAKSIIRRYDERGIYYEWDDGPHGWD